MKVQNKNGMKKEEMEKSIEVTWLENTFYSDKVSSKGCRPFEW